MAFMSVALMSVGGVAAWYLHRLQVSSTRLLSESIAKVTAAAELETISHELRYRLRHYVATRDAEDWAGVATLQRDLDRCLAQAAATADSEQEAALLQRMARSYRRLFGDFQHAVAGDARAAQTPDLVDLLHRWSADAILTPARDFVELTHRQAQAADRRHQQVTEYVGWGLRLFGLCGALAGLLLGYGLARSLRRSFAQLTIPVRDAAGHLNEVVGPITVFSGETFEELERELQSVADRVGVVVSRLHATLLAASRAEQLAAMGQLAAGLAHELRNPLTSMKMLLQPSDEREIAVQLDVHDQLVLREEIERLERTIQTFLDYARPPKLERHPLVMRDLLAQTVAFLTPRARRLKIEIRTQAPQEVVLVEADAGQMRQVLLNLLLNAMESFTGPGVIDVCISHTAGAGRAPAADPDQPPGRWMTIQVADRGCGLPVELGDRVFEPFVSTKEGGTGLGLPICRRIIEDHGGEIAAENRVGGGSLFSIRLPVILPDARAPAGESSR